MNTNKNKIVPRENDNQAVLVDNVRRTDVNKCRTCQVIKPIDYFYDLKKNPDCKQCRSEKDKITYKNNINKFRDKSRKFRQEYPEKVKDQNLKILYNISLEDYNKKFNDQKGLCEICNKPEKFSKRYNKQLNLAVDHDHITGKIRGLICTRCNITLGRMEENISIISNMIDYIKKYQKSE